MISILTALSPIVLLFLLMVVFRLPAIKSMPIVWLYTVFFSWFVWKMDLFVISAASVKGIVIAFEIMLIVIGAIFLLEILKEAHIILVISSMLKQMSSDKRIHTIIIAWTFGAFIEGAAGFGTSAALAAPLLVGLGIPAVSAVIVSLIANSTPVSFGAVGTPVIIGLGTTLQNIDLDQITIYTAIIHSIIGLFIPLLMSCVLSRLGKEKSFRKGLEIWKFAIFAGACFVIPYLIVAVILGPEFPSLIGGIIGFLVLIFSAREGFLIPKKYRVRKLKMDKKRSFYALIPYVLVGVILFITRINFINIFLKTFAFRFENLFGAGLSYSFYPLLSPGLIFILVGLMTVFLFKESKKEVKSALNKTLAKGVYTFVALAFTVSLVQLLIISGNNTAGFESMPIVVAKGFAELTGKTFILFSPLLGAFGAFIAGSNTVSNMLFAAFQNETAITLGLPVIIIIALQNVGGAVGNMVAVHNVIVASATVGLKGQEGKIIRYNILPSIVYALLAGIIGYVIIKIIF